MTTCRDKVPLLAKAAVTAAQKLDEANEMTSPPGNKPTRRTREEKAFTDLLKTLQRHMLRLSALGSLGSKQGKATMKPKNENPRHSTLMLLSVKQSA